LEKVQILAALIYQELQALFGIQLAAAANSSPMRFQTRASSYLALGIS